MAVRSILFIVAILLPGVSPLQADTYTVEKKKKEIAVVKEEITDLQHKITTKAPPVQAEIAQVRAQHSQLEVVHSNIDQRVNSYNASCAGRPVNAGCQSTLASINNDKAQYQASLASYSQRNARVHAQMQEIIGFADRIKELRGRLQQLEAELSFAMSDGCRSLGAGATDEQIKNLCGNVQFDGSSIKLKSCNTDRCRAYDRLQQ